MTIYLHYSNQAVPSLLIEYGNFKTLDTSEIELTKEDLVVNWGDAPSNIDIEQAWVLNSNNGLKNCTGDRWKEILPIHGIPVADEVQVFRRKYAVYVFQLKVVVLLAEQQDIWYANETKPLTRYRMITDHNLRLEYRKVKKLAIRAIHSLGLDFGMVLIGCNSSGSYVIRVSTTPKLTAKMAPLFVEEIRETYTQLNIDIEPSKVVLGADPEFILRHDNGSFVLASNYFPKHGSVGCDQIWLRGDKTKTKLPIVELRPSPSSEPRILFRNIYEKLIDANRKISNPHIQFLAGSSPLKGYPIGGHIHFSNVPLTSFLLRALDNYLTLSLFILEDPAGFRRRPKYGFIGDFREQFHGGFEYRTPPSWLVAPRLTKGVLALAKLIAVSYPNLRQVPLSNPTVMRAYYDGQQREVYDIVLSLWEDVRAQPLYEQYQSYLDPFYETILRFEQWNEMTDFRIRWRIPPYNRN